MKLLFSKLLLALSIMAAAQEIKSFELRYITTDPEANGPTDFKGKKEFLSLEQRVAYLSHYAGYAKNFFSDPHLDTRVVHDEEVAQVLENLKAQPLPETRERIPMNELKWTGYRQGMHVESLRKLQWWNSKEGMQVQDGALELTWDYPDLLFRFPSQAYRSRIELLLKTPEHEKPVELEFSDKELVHAATIRFHKGMITYVQGDKQEQEAMAYAPGQWYDIRLEFDFAAIVRRKDVTRYNLYINDSLVADYVPMQRVVTEGVGYAHNFASIPYLNCFRIKAPAGTQLDDLWGVGYHATRRETYPYSTETFLDEDFEVAPSMEGWQTLNYADGEWEAGTLPLAHGSERHFGEDLYIRKKLRLDDFKQVWLNVETLTPGGKIWVNGQEVALINSRHPVRVEISRFCKPHMENVIAMKVNSFYLSEHDAELMPHSSLDLNVGWFAGRAWLDLVEATHIEDAFVYTRALEDDRARLNLQLTIRNGAFYSFSGKAVVEASPWFPHEGAAVVLDTLEVHTGVGNFSFEEEMDLVRPQLWTDKTPRLYKFRVRLLDENNREVDDYVLTTGIRTVDQEGGRFRLNGKVSMLNGAQIMGFRGPLEDMMKQVYCAPDHWIARELLQIRKMNGNFLRVHVHAFEFPSANINDPRYLEMADQLGIMVAWGTPAWVRTGRGWGHIDWEGYPLYMKQVRQHPSLVVWEVANHTQGFKDKDVQESNTFVRQAYQTVYSQDPSRLISVNSYIKHLHYGNDEGTVDQEGNPIAPTPEWTAPGMTRGNQDGLTGYTADWSKLRTWPDDYTRSFLDSRERAYFNFEHEESMGQPNWNLCKGKPWYLTHSYEWAYDEGTIGRRLSFEEWEESQAWQAFSAWESMKKQRWLGYDGFSWCCLHGGANSVTYKKPLIDFAGHAKLAWHTNRMIFQPTVAGSADVDLVYGPADQLTPLILNWNQAQKVDLTVLIKDLSGAVVQEKHYPGVMLEEGRTARRLEGFTPEVPAEGYYIIEYHLN